MTRAAFEELAAEIVARLRNIVAAEKSGIDGLWFDIHGAMCVEGLDDVEAELLRRVRTVVGSEVIVSASMDLHGNVSRELAHQTDLITCFRMVGSVILLDSRLINVLLLTVTDRLRMKTPWIQRRGPVVIWSNF